MSVNVSPFGPVQKWGSGVRGHRLNVLCSCGHAKWLHDAKCVALRVTDGFPAPCSCRHTREDFA